MPSRGYVLDQSFDDDYSPRAVARPAEHSLLSRLTHFHLREWLVVIAAAFAMGMIVVNALFLQSGPHPAPMFAQSKPPPVGPMILPRPRPAVPGADTAANLPARPGNEVVAEIQRQLAARGFYDGPTDGQYGPKTDIAIRDFEQAAQLRPSIEPNETLLRAIAQSAAKPQAATANKDPIAGLLAPSKRVVAIQRALATYGYGQIKATGAYDPETRIAIETFERSRNLPVTGLISDRVTRELAAVTGRPLE